MDSAPPGSEWYPHVTQSTLRPGLLARNAVWLVGGEVVGRLIALGVAVYLARVLGAEGYGRIGAALAFVSYLIIVMNAGLDPHGSREVARCPEGLPAVLSRVLGLRLWLSVVAYGTLALLVYLLPDRAAGGRALALIFGGRLFVQAANTAWALRGRDEMRKVALGVWIREITNAIGILTLVRGPRVVLLFVPLVHVTAELLQTFFYLLVLRTKYTPLWDTSDRSKWRGMVRESFPVAGSKALRLLFYQGDVLLITWLYASQEAGYFLASHKIVIAIVTLTYLYHDNVYPTLSRLWLNDRTGASRLLENVNRYGLVAAMPIAVAVSATSGQLVALLFGDSFQAAAPVLATTIFSVPLMLVLAGLNNQLLVAGRAGDLMRSEATGTLLHLVSAIWWIPLFGALGAGRASVLGRIGALLAATFYVRRQRGRLPVSRKTGLVLLSGALMGALILWLPGTSLGGRLVLGGVVYGMSLLALRVVEIDEIKRLLISLRRDV